MFIRQLAMLSPDWAIVMLTVGVLLIYVELNRPGWVIPGAVGLLATLFAVASVARLEVSLGGVALVGTGVGLLAVDLVRRTPVVVAAAGTLALVLGLRQLVVGAGGLLVHTTTAVFCGVILGVGTAILTRVARRARTNKGLD
jgi:membrane-bound serine protease (ClpP class)